MERVLEKELTCPLCMDIFKEPKKLPCDHVYCKACLIKLEQHSASKAAEITCPECRHVTNLADTSVSNFPTDFRLNRFVEVYEKIRARGPVQSPGTDGSKFKDSAENCRDHPTQPLAMYCKTCKKLLCRDCVLKTKDHTSHEHGFFAEVTPTYREMLLSKYFVVNNRASPVSHALKKLSSISNCVKNHSEKCQVDIDHAFKRLYAVMNDFKETLKLEADAYYHSLMRRVKLQKDQLEVFNKKLGELSTSFESVLQDSDEKFLSEMDSVVDQIENINEKIPLLPLDVAEPQPLAVQIISEQSLRSILRSQCFLNKVANPNICTIEESLLTSAQIGQQIELNVTLADFDGNLCQSGENIVEVEVIDHRGESTKTNIRSISPGRSNITFTTVERGQHELNVKVNGRHIQHSPFSFVVDVPPTSYSEPVSTIRGLKRPVGLTCIQGKVTATEMDNNRIIQIDSQLQVQQLFHLVGVNKLTQDSDYNLYVTTVGDNRLHKICKGRESILSVGKPGKQEAEFNYPNGLRVSPNNELYVCDSKNRRVQVFDLDLKFKRQVTRTDFDFPSDVDFDSSGRIYVVDFWRHCIDVFTSDEHHVSVIESRLFTDSSFVLFNPIDLIVRNDYVYVTNYGSHKVLVLDKAGKIVTTVGENCLYRPEGITVDDNGFVYVTSHNSKIFVF